MKLSCTQENLNQGLFVVSHVASKGATLPILNNILIQAKKDEIKLAATNLEIGVTCTMRGTVEESGEFTVQSRLFADYVNLLSKDRVDLMSPKTDDDDQVLSIKCGQYSTKIKGQPATDFPVIPSIEKAKPYLVDFDDFRRALSQVVFAVAVTETRPEISGVCFNFSEQTLVMAATDSFRLAEKNIALSSGSSTAARKVIVPAKTLQEVQRILGSIKDPASISEINDVKLFVVENQIVFVIGAVELISRLVEGQYPDYRQIIPAQFKTTAILEVAELVKAVKTTSLFSRTGIYDVNLQFATGNKEVVISSTNSQLGESITHLTAPFQGDPVTLVVNYRYLLDGLQNINADQIECKIVDALNPCALKPQGDHPDYIYIIMPIRQ